jgi:hypothetical protein
MMHRPSQLVQFPLAALAFIAILGWMSAGSALGGEEPEPDKTPFEPTDHYAIREIERWKVYVNSGFERDKPELCREVLDLLGHQLYQITRMVPAAAVEKLRKIPVWVELNEPHHPCMCYHPDAGWLRAHDMNPEKARSIEIANARNFLAWTKQQPWMVFHELAHGYHDQFVEGGYDNADLAEALSAAKDEKLYDNVLHIDGRRQRHYALTNQREYFAEQSEALFGTNDFFPFVRSELEHHDPRIFALLNRLWRADADDKK